MKNKNIEKLKLIAASQMPDKESEKLDFILAKRQVEKILDAERKELKELMQLYSKGILEKAEAMAELKLKQT